MKQAELESGKDFLGEASKLLGDRLDIKKLGRSIDKRANNKGLLVGSPNGFFYPTVAVGLFGGGNKKGGGRAIVGPGVETRNRQMGKEGETNGAGNGGGGHGETVRREGKGESLALFYAKFVLFVKNN